MSAARFTINWSRVVRDSLRRLAPQAHLRLPAPLRVAISPY